MSQTAEPTTAALRIGLDWGAARIAGTARDGEGRVRAARERIAPAEEDAAGNAAVIAELVGALENDVGTDSLPVGIALAGPAARGDAAADGGTRSDATEPRPRGDELAAALGPRVRLANRAYCLALAEARGGAGAEHRCVFGATLGFDIGGALIFDGAPRVGRNGLVGAWGHTPLPWATPAEARQRRRCECGLENCLQTWLSGPSMSADHRRRGGYVLGAREIVARAENGERLAGATLRAWLERAARALALVVSVADPDIIVLGGGLSNIGWLYSEVPKIWAGYTPAARLATPLVTSAHGADAITRGAALLWP